MPVGSKMVWPRKIVIIVGEPIPAPVGDGTGRVKRSDVRRMTEQLQAALQALLDEARAAAR
jgi:hypothetical protein